MFVLEPLSAIKGPVLFFKLKIGQHCPLDEFWEQTKKEGNMNTQLHNALALMERFSRGLPTAPNKIKNISRKGDRVTHYEIKTRDLRIYFFRNADGAIVVTGGKKSTQKKDITLFRNLVTRFVNQQVS